MFVIEQRGTFPNWHLYTGIEYGDKAQCNSLFALIKHGGKMNMGVLGNKTKNISVVFSREHATL